MGIKHWLGLEEPETAISGSQIGVSMTNVTLPLDVALILVFRQQDQIMTALNEMKAKIEINEALFTVLRESMSRIHDDIRDLQGAQQGSAPEKPKRLVH